MSDYDAQISTPPASDRHCPRCAGVQTSDGEPLDDGQASAVCVECGWHGRAAELMTAAELADEARLWRADL